MAARDRARAAGDEQTARQEQARSNRATEALGEQATDAAVREMYPDADIDGAHQGRGPGTFDRVYENGSPPPRYIIAEGKGGSASNSSVRRGQDGRLYQQGTGGYRDSVARNMERNGGTVRERSLGRGLANADPEDVAYLEVTQPIDGSGGLGRIHSRQYEDR